MDEITEHWVTMWNYGIFSVIPQLCLHRPGFFIYQTTYISSLSCPYIIKQYHVFIINLVLYLPPNSNESALPGSEQH